MRGLVQRVSRAGVTIDGEAVASIGRGLLVLVGVSGDDTVAEAEKLARKLWNLRVFEDDTGAMNLSAADLGTEMLVVSQFTLYGDTRKGRRPSFVAAARPEQAEPLIAHLVEVLRLAGAAVATGRFGAHMAVELVNDGPVTLLLEV
ncbi:MAG: D-aminoacyl-tRNA deacylase [Acidimicrobiales bacterium]|nr:MAG: D-tyrosyl-tRNA(Tyr) deacylase [Actinomycetota bacterium]MBV6508522.1 D-aminoacyl-tRNA deacylase [Acidimicrobiales bacterium]RIK05162.1 MAG: D-tyrosyl-tRNA(Tyr) deacylase [Acidobacteriota bacterium]